MKKILFAAVLFTFLFLSTGSLHAQEKEADYPFIISATGDYYLPIGSLADRFNGTFGGTIYFGKQTSDSYTWLGKLEYFKFSDVNTDQQNKSIDAEIGDALQTFIVPLTDLEMELEVYGFGVETRMNIIRTDIIESDLNFGFGFYYWNFKRDAYLDSVFVDTTGAGNQALISVIDVPENNQKDWSGTLNAGVNISIQVFQPVWFTAGANYKLIIGELWPSLSLDMESVSGMQMLDLRAGIKVKLE